MGGGSADVLVTLPWYGDADDPAVGPLWEALTQELGFEDEEYGQEPAEPRASSGRPSLSRLETSLFDFDPSQRKLGTVAGLTILGGPRGRGPGPDPAREVLRRLDAGIASDDMMILVPHWDDDAARAVEILEDAGIAVSAEVPRPLASDPAVAALLLAAGIAAGGWESTALVRLLRNGAIAPDWADADARAEAASAVASLRVFRGRSAIASALDREGRHGDRRRVARTLLDRLALVLDGASRAGVVGPINATGSEAWPRGWAWRRTASMRSGMLSTITR